MAEDDTPAAPGRGMLSPLIKPNERQWRGKIIATRRFEGWILRPVIFCVLSLLVEADCNFAQTGILPIRPAPNLELLAAKRKHLVICAQDFLDFAEFSHSYSLEREVACKLNKVAAENDARVSAMIMLLEIFRTVHCKGDLVRIKVLLALDFAKYSKPIDLDIESVDLQIPSTKRPGVAAEATQMRDDLNEIESILHSTISSLSKAS